MAYLTIDDAPSALFAEKLAYLERKGIPALIFCIGEKASGREKELAGALAAGFALGNHSYSHPRFSAIPFEECRSEIHRTDALLRSVYRLANMAWKRKFFRFPYLDRGGDIRKISLIQDCLRADGYLGPAAQEGAWADVACGFDQMEYYFGTPEAPDGLGAREAILARIDDRHPARDDIILIHDHEYSHELFFECVDRYLANGTRFSRLG